MAVWDTYAQLCRSLNDARSHQRQQSGSASGRYATLAQRVSRTRAGVDESAQRLQHLSAILGLPLPALAPLYPQREPGNANIADVLTSADQAAQLAREFADRSEQRGLQAWLLPGWHPLARDVIVYAACSFLFVLIELWWTIGAVRSSPDWVSVFVVGFCFNACFGLVAFGAGFVLTLIVAVPRIKSHPTISPKVWGALRYLSWVAGLFVCMAPGPIIAVIVAIASHKP